MKSSHSSMVVCIIGFVFLASCLADAGSVGDEPAPSLDTRGEEFQRSNIVSEGPVSISATAQCGSTCPAGQHAVSRLCTRSCNGGFTCTSSSSLNTVYCEPNTPSFLQCGASCPSGWHSTSKFCNANCQNGLPCQYFIINAAQCVVDSGTFSQCGTTCPSGWVRTSSYCNSQCQNGIPCTGSSSSNAATCRPQ